MTEPRLPDKFPDDPTASCIPTMRTAGTVPAPSRASSDEMIPPTRWDLARDPEGLTEGIASPAEEAAAPKYFLKAIIGQGGCGEVWEATQHSLGRTIAIKRVRADHIADARESSVGLSRLEADFRQEALTTARLEHPNIVPVYDYGIDEFGHPLLAMKLVRGESWNNLLRRDAESMPPAEFLAKHVGILIAVAQAVAFAHSRGIIHRDLKPAQVMVGKYGETMLMDWGLAVYRPDLRSSESSRESIEISTQDLPSHTSASSPAGTFAYMAPEQTEPTAENVGPWTDIFLLGGTLYSLLTGTPPHQGATARDVFYAAADCRIELPEHRAPHRTIPRELSVIAVACLQRRPQDRLDSAMLLVERLQAFLTGASRRRESEELATKAEQSLLATEKRGGIAARDLYRAFGATADQLAQSLRLWPENAKAAELAGRNLAARIDAEIAHGDLLLAEVHLDDLERAHPALVAGRRSRLESEVRRRDAVRRQRKLFAGAAIGSLLLVLVVGFVAYRQTSAQRARALKAREDAERLASFMSEDMTQKLASVGRISLVGSALDRMAAYYGGLEEEDLSPSAMREAASVLLRIAAVRLQTAPGDASAILDPIGKAESLVDALAQSSPVPSDALIRANARYLRAFLPGLAPDRVLADLSAARTAAASIAPLSGEVEENRARLIALADVAMLPTLVLMDQEDAILQNLADSKVRMDALAPAATTLPFKQTRVLLLETFGSYWTSKSNYSAASAELRAAIAAARDLLREDPQDRRSVEQLASVLYSFALSQSAQHEHEAALEALSESEQLYSGLVLRDPDDLQLVRSCASVQSAKVDLMRELGRPAEAMAAQRNALDTIRKLASASPGDIEVQLSLSDELRSYAKLLIKEAEFPDALAAVEEARRITEALLPSVPGSLVLLRDVGDSWSTQAALYAAWARDERANEAEAEALKYYRRAYDIDRSDPANALALARALTSQAGAAGRRLDRQRSVDLFTEALAVSRELYRQDPDRREFRSQVATVLFQRSAALGNLERLEEAYADTTELLSLVRRLHDDDPQNAYNVRMLVVSLTEMGKLLRGRGDFEGSERHYREAAELAKVENFGPSDTFEHLRLRGTALEGLAETIRNSKRESALHALTESAQLLRQHLALAPNETLRLRTLGTTLRSLASVREAMGDADGAMEARWEYVQTLGRAAELSPVANNLNELAWGQIALGKSLLDCTDYDNAIVMAESAAATYAKLRAERPLDPNLANFAGTAMLLKARALGELGRPEDARAAYQAAASILSPVAEAVPRTQILAPAVEAQAGIGDLEAARRTALLLAAQGYWEPWLEDMLAGHGIPLHRPSAPDHRIAYAERRSYLQQVVGATRDLISRRPADPIMRQHCLNALANLAFFENERGFPAEALSPLAQIETLLGEISAAGTANPFTHRMETTARFELSESLRSLGDWHGALDALVRGCPGLEAELAEGDEFLAVDSAQRRKEAELLAALGNREGASRQFEQSLALAEAAADSGATARTLAGMAQMLLLAGNAAEARSMAEQAAEFAAEPGLPPSQRAAILLALARARAATGDAGGARSAALAILDSVPDPGRLFDIALFMQAQAIAYGNEAAPLDGFAADPFWELPGE